MLDSAITMVFEVGDDIQYPPFVDEASFLELLIVCASLHSAEQLSHKTTTRPAEFGGHRTLILP
jgi:hypothetical protein